MKVMRVKARRKGCTASVVQIAKPNPSFLPRKSGFCIIATAPDTYKDIEFIDIIIVN